jgi:hypothetical protein
LNDYKHFVDCYKIIDKIKNKVEFKLLKNNKRQYKIAIILNDSFFCYTTRYEGSTQAFKAWESLRKLIKDYNNEKNCSRTKRKRT